MALVMQNRSFPPRMGSSKSPTETALPTKPSSWARLCRMPNTTGVMEMDSVCFKLREVSAMSSHRELAGHTAS